MIQDKTLATVVVELTTGTTHKTSEIDPQRATGIYDGIEHGMKNPEQYATLHFPSHNGWRCLASRYITEVHMDTRTFKVHHPDNEES